MIALGATKIGGAFNCRKRFAPSPLGIASALEQKRVSIGIDLRAELANDGR
jgi:hypothetical protein